MLLCSNEFFINESNMKYIIIAYLFSLSLLHSMDLVPLLEKNLNQESETYFEEIFPSIKLSKIGKYYENLSPDCRGKVILRMSENALALHRLAMWLPQEVQRHILVYMFGGYQNDKVDLAVERFCSTPIGEAVQVLYDIKQAIREEEPIAPLYVLDTDEQYIFLNRLTPWYSAITNQFMDVEERQWVDELNEDERVYFKDKVIHKCPKKYNHICILCMACMAGLCLASTVTFFCGLGSLCCGMNSKSVPWCMGGIYAGGCLGGCGIGACCLYRNETKKEVL